MSVHHVQRPEGGEPAVTTTDQPITEHEALGWLPHTCFRTGPPHRTGLELELLLTTNGPTGDHVPPSDRAALLADLQALPLRSRLTVEPGGQIELSTPPADDVVAATDHLDHDLALVRPRVAHAGLDCSARDSIPAEPLDVCCTTRGTRPWRPTSTAAVRPAER